MYQSYFKPGAFPGDQCLIPAERPGNVKILYQLPEREFNPFRAAAGKDGGAESGTFKK